MDVTSGRRFCDRLAYTKRFWKLGTYYLGRETTVEFTAIHFAAQEIEVRNRKPTDRWVEGIVSINVVGRLPYGIYSKHIMSPQRTKPPRILYYSYSHNQNGIRYAHNRKEIRRYTAELIDARP